MINIDNLEIKNLLEKIVASFVNETPLDPSIYDLIIAKPEYGLEVMLLLPEASKNPSPSEDSDEEEPSPLFMACLHYIEMCLMQLKLAQEHHQKWADELITHYQNHLLRLLEKHETLTCWLPVINLFFDAEIHVSEEIKEMYLKVVENNQKHEELMEKQQLIVEQLLSDSSDASDFEIAELFLSQTNALPIDYFPSFLKELIAFNVTKAFNASLLFLLHPVLEVREMIIEHLEAIFEEILLPGESMSRLLMIRHWLPNVEKSALEQLIHCQRKKGAVFSDLRQAEIIEIQATEMDGTGTQAVFLIIKRKKGFQAAGLLAKRYYGIKDTWLGPIMSKSEAKSYAKDSLHGDFILRKVNATYLELLIADHISQAQKIDAVPHLNLLQIQEITGSQWQAQPLNIEAIIDKLLTQCPEINKEWHMQSLERSSHWYKKHKFTDSWYDEGPDLDKIVNQFCFFEGSVKKCNVSKALPVVIQEYFEERRGQWLEHFIWLTLWAQPSARHNEYLWKDALIISYSLYSNIPMLQIPILRVIAEHSILQSVETMESRKTHLTTF